MYFELFLNVPDPDDLAQSTPEIHAWSHPIFGQSQGIPHVFFVKYAELTYRFNETTQKQLSH